MSAQIAACSARSGNWPGRGSPVAGQLEPESAAIEVSGLLRVAHPELEIVGSVDRERIVSGFGCWGGGGSHGGDGGKVCGAGAGRVPRSIAESNAGKYALLHETAPPGSRCPSARLPICPSARPPE